MKEKPYTPTRRCPHQWCKPLHLAPGPFALAAVAFDLWHNWLFLLPFALGSIGMWWLSKALHIKPRQRTGPVKISDVVQDIKEAPSPVELEMEDALYEGTGWRVLEVHKGWARVAVGCDLLLAAMIGLLVTEMFSDPAAAAQRSSSVTLDASTFVGIGVALLFMGFMIYAHKKATQPRKPKRAWIPAFLRTNV